MCYSDGGRRVGDRSTHRRPNARRRDDEVGARLRPVVTPSARRAIAVDEANRSLGAEVFSALGATFVRSRALPIIHDLNHVGVARTGDPQDIDALMARVEEEFAGYRHRQFVLDPETPTALEARLVQ